MTKGTRNPARASEKSRTKPLAIERTSQSINREAVWRSRRWKIAWGSVGVESWDLGGCAGETLGIVVVQGSAQAYWCEIPWPSPATSEKGTALLVAKQTDLVRPSAVGFEPAGDPSRWYRGERMRRGRGCHGGKIHADAYSGLDHMHSGKQPQ